MFKSLNIKDLSDELLLQKYLKENNNWFLEELLGRHIRFVFLVCMKYLKNEEKANDMAMQVFEKVLKDIKRFEIINFKSWLHVVTKNACLMQLRSEKPDQTVRLDIENVTTQVMENDGILHHNIAVDKEMQLVQLENALNSLDAKQKQCVELFYIEEKSYKEVAEITGFSLNDVKSNIQNGKRNLKNLLVNKGEMLLFIFVCIYF